MQTWQIIVASAVAASIAAVALFLPEAARSPAGIPSLLPTYWPGLTIIWLTVYAIAVLVLSTAAAARQIGDIEPGPGGMRDGGTGDWTGGMDWARRYLARLGISQYFSAVLALLALGLLPLAVATEPYLGVPLPSGASPALSACAVTILAGVLGWTIITVAAAFRPPPLWTAPPAGLDVQLLQQILDLLRARPAEPSAAATELAEQLRHRDHATLEAIKELAGAVSRVRAGISEIQHGLHQRGPELTDQSGSGALADIAAALHTATAALGSTVARLEDVAAGLAAAPSLGLPPPARGNLPAGSRAQLSTELQELLRDIAAPAPRREDPR